MNTFILFVIVIFILFVINKKKTSQFGEVQEQPPSFKKEEEYHLDTRYEYPTVPPVNPNVYKSLIVKSTPVESGLYSQQDYSTNDFIIDQNKSEYNNTNQLNYSGGSTEILKIPLQMNEPYNEQLRSQEILITPYNKIKYQM